MSYLRGFDAAFPQGAIRWDEVPPEFRFVIVQVANGVAGRDPTGPPNLAGVKRTHRYCGVYLFFHEELDAAAQVANLWGACGGEVPHFIALDFETLAKGQTPTQAVATLRAAIAECRARFGRIPIVVYTYPNFDLQVMGAALAQASDLADQAELWIADYGKGENVDGKTPWIVPPWKTWRLWQTSGNNSSYIPGVNGHVDHDVFAGDEAAFRAWLGLDAAGEASAPIVHPDVDMPAPDPSET